MGGDGGTKSLQRKYIRGAQDKAGWEGWGISDGKPASKAELMMARVSMCSLTQKPLKEPIASCRLGNLFNKNDMVLALQAKRVEGTPLPSAFKHIRGLSDITTLRLTPNPAATATATATATAAGNGFAQSSNGMGAAPQEHSANLTAQKAATMEDLVGGGDLRPAPFMCPITRLELNGRNKFYVVFESGGVGPVLAERCLKRMKPEDLVEEVGRTFTRDECVLLCPDKEEYARMRKALVAEFKAAKALKRIQKKQRKSKQWRQTQQQLAINSAPHTVDNNPGSAPVSSKRKALNTYSTVAADGTLPIVQASQTLKDSVDHKKLKKDKKHKRKKDKRSAVMGEVCTSATYAGIGEEARQRVDQLHSKNRVFASIFKKEKTLSGSAMSEGREKQANLFIRVAGRMY